MIPELSTVARGRYVARVVLRVAVFAWLVYSVWRTCDYLFTNLGGFLGSGVFAWLFDLLLPLVVRLGLAVGVLLLEKRLVRWLVPLGSRQNVCPRCGYALKDLRSPVCPECGLDLRGASGGPGPTR
jgi:hypothetical protein